MSSLRLTLGLLFVVNGLVAQNVEILFPFDFTTAFQDVYVASDGHGFAVGSCGVLAETTDSGQSWSITDAPTDFATMVACTPGTNCQEVWIAADGELHYSTDGGSSWANTSVPELGDPTEILFLSDQVLLLTHRSDGIFRSTDGGATWTLVATNLNYRSLPDFVTDQVGFLVDQDGFNFLTSTDAGATWDSIYHFDVRPLYLDMLDAQNGFLLLDNRILWSTADGGNNWQVVTGTAVNANPRHLFALDEQTLIATSFPSRFIKSTDGGQTWSPTPVSIDEGHYGLRINGIHRQGDSFWLASDASSVISTTDGFETLSNTLPADRESIESIQFVDENIGYALCERRGFFKTTDGGDSWTRVETDFGTVSRDFLVLGADDIVIPYNSDGPQRSLDGGETWVPLFPADLQDTVFVFQIEQLPGGRLYLMGGVHAAYSDDNGATWTPVYHEMGGFSDMLYFYDDQLGFAGGQGGRLHRTDDGGLTWTNISTGDITSQPIRDLYMRDALNGFINVSTTTYCTDDGGLTWSTQNCQGYDPPESVIEGPDGTLYSRRRLFDGIEISRSMDQGLTWEMIQTDCERNLQLYSVTPDNRYLYLGWTGSLMARFDLNTLVFTDEQLPQVETLRVFPNPSSGQVQLRLESVDAVGQPASIRVFTVNGQLVQQFNAFTQPLLTIDLSHVPAGLYLVELRSEKYRGQARVVKY